MSLVQIYKQFPDHSSCIRHLEKVRWNNVAQCPYCNSTKTTPVSKELRYHCNNCNTSFSVTVGTVFHNSKLDIQKWFLAISIILDAKKGISVRQFARDIEVTKDTAWLMMMRIRKAKIVYGAFLEEINETAEAYVGGTNKDHHLDKTLEEGQERGGEQIH